MLWALAPFGSMRSWGYTRIQGALANLRHEISWATVANVLKAPGLNPAPTRRKGMTWKDFFEGALGGTGSHGFLYGGTWDGNRINSVSCFLRHQTASGAEFGGSMEWLLNSSRYLVHDRGAHFCEHFRELLRSALIEPLRLPARSPNLSAYAECFVRTIRARMPESDGFLWRRFTP